MPTTAGPRPDDRPAPIEAPTLVSLLVSVERRIGELAVAAGAQDENGAAEARTELRRISEAMDRALGHDGP